MTVTDAPGLTRSEVTVVPDRAKVSLVVAGDVDMSSVYEIENAAAELVTAGFDAVAIDLSGVRFIDSTGLRALLRTREHAQEHGCRLVLVAPRSRSVLRIFDVTGTYGLFDWKAPSA